MLRRTLFWIALATAACGPLEYPECTSAFICDLESGGACVRAPSGRRWCQYPATIDQCPSGWHWSIQAGDGLAGGCVAASAVVDAGQVDGPVEEPDAAASDAAAPDTAPPPDASIDAAPPDAAPPDAMTTGPVTVAALDTDWKPLAGANVMAHDAEGAITASMTTNAAGLAVIDTPIGGMITVATRIIDVQTITTVVGVKPFDTLTTLAEGASRFNGPKVGTATIRFPGSKAGANTYRAAISCQRSLGGSSDPVTEMTGDVYRDCLEAPNTVNAIVIAQADDDKPLALNYGTTTLSGGFADLTFQQWADVADHEIRVENVPAAATSTSFTVNFTYRDATLQMNHEVLELDHYRTSVPEFPSSIISLRADFTLSFPSEGANISSAILRTTFPLPGVSPSIVDANRAPPRIHAIANWEFETGRPRLSWEQDGGGAAMTAGLVYFHWDSPGPGKPSVKWIVVTPPAGPVRTPALIPVVSAVVPHTAPQSLGVALIDPGPRARTYDAFRAFFVPYFDVKSTFYDRLSIGGSIFH